MWTISCRFCACEIEWWRARVDLAFYFIGDEERHTCRGAACREKAGAEILEDERRAA